MDMQKCAVIGCGAVGAAAAFTLLQSGLFSQLILLDSNTDKAHGEAEDMAHCAPFIPPTEVYAGDYPDLADCGVIIITAGAAQNPGETRLDLVKRNAAIMQSIVPQIVKYNKDAILIIVSNPVDILTHVALKLSGFPPQRVIGSGTVLDTGRLKYLLGSRFGIDPHNVHAFVIGEHGDTEVPLWSGANISGVNLADYCKSHGGCGQGTLDDVFSKVKNSAYHIIENKGSTCYAIAMALLRICKAIVRNENSVLPVSSLANGQYGIHDACIGLPSIVGREGIREILEFRISETEGALLAQSAKTLKAVLDDLGEPPYKMPGK